MEVKMENRLASSCSRIGDDPKVREPLGLCNSVAYLETVAQKLSLLRGRIAESHDGSFGNHENVDRGDRLDVPERETEFILKDNVGGQFSVDYFRKNRTHEQAPLFVYWKVH